MKKNTIKLALLVQLVLLGLFVFKFSTSAQEALPLTAFPATQEKEVVPGQKTRAQLQFKNNSASFVTGRVRVADYVINDKDGTPTLVEDGTLKPKYGAAAWIKPNYDALTIAPNDFVTIDLFITPPPVVDTCGRYAIVYLETQGTNINFPGTSKASSTAITTKLGALLNLRIKKSDCKEGLQISRVDSVKFMEYGPIKVSFDLFNTGDVDVRPKGIVTAANMLGRTSDQQVIKDQRIFPETVRIYESLVGKKWMFGKYKVSLVAVYGQSGGRVEKTIEVVVFPWKVTLITVLTALVLIVLLRNYYNQTVVKEGELEKEVAQEKAEIDKLKEQLRRRKD